MFKFFDLIKERDEYGCLVCVLVVRGGNLKFLSCFMKYLIYFLLMKIKRICMML